MIPEEPLQPGELKETLLRYACRFDENDFDRNWSGCLNESNIFFVAARLLKILEDKIFAIAEFRYVDTPHPAYDLRTDCYFNSRGTSGSQDKVRVFIDSRAYIGFSAGGYYWSWDAAPGSEYDDSFRYAHIDFDNNCKVTFKQRAPNGTLHVHIFMLQRENKIEDVR